MLVFMDHGQWVCLNSPLLLHSSSAIEINKISEFIFMIDLTFCALILYIGKEAKFSLTKVICGTIQTLQK